MRSTSSSSVSDCLSIYLNDHFAGSVAALNLLRSISERKDRPDLASFSAKLHQEIEADQEVLAELMKQLAIEQTKTRSFLGWLAGKAAEKKMRMDATVCSEYFYIQAFESLTLGISGKLALWKALAAIAERLPVEFSSRLPSLIERARDQRERVETERLKMAAQGLG